MRYSNEICPVCKNEFTESDDIVVCPECGTPSHRECYNISGGCINADLHKDGFSWSPALIKKENSPGIPDIRINSSEAEYISGEKPDNEEKFNNINSRLSYDGLPGIVNLLKSLHISPDTEIEATPIVDIALYLQVSIKSYLKNFMISSKSLSWNWGAFFFTPFWFFYRKLYRVGTAFLGIMIALFFFTSPYYDSIETEYSGFFDEYTAIVADAKSFADLSSEQKAELDKLSADASAMLRKSMPPLAVLLTVNILMRTAAALTANKFYKKQVINDIGVLKRKYNDRIMFRQMTARRGGVSLLGALGSMSGYYLIINLAMRLIGA